MSVTDEALMAYVDGEADPATREAVEAAMRADPDVARRVAEQRELRARLRAAFTADLAEPVPSRLTDAVLAGARPRSESRPGAAAFGAARTARSVRRAPLVAWGIPAALAASLALGVGLGLLLSRQRTPWVAGDAHGLVAEGPLERALSASLGGEHGAPIGIGVSFRGKDGRYCRSFRIAMPSPAAGLACRDADAWRIALWTRSAAAASASGEEPGADYRPAASEWPPELLAAIEARADGEPLDRKAEEAARAQGWRAAR